MSPAGHKAGAEKVIRDLNEWIQSQLSKPKQLRGGIEIVEVVRLLYFLANPPGADYGDVDTQKSYGKGSAPGAPGSLYEVTWKAKGQVVVTPLEFLVCGPLESMHMYNLI